MNRSGLPKRRYTLRMAAAMAAYLIALASSIRLLQTFRPGHAMTVVLAVLPSIPLVAVIVIVGIYLREEADEFQRQLMIQSLLWGMGCTLAVTSVWGFLEMFSGARHVSPFYVFVLFWVFTGLSGWPLRRYYRTGND